MEAETLTYKIYRGVWINWSHGKVFGSTLTLSRSDGTLLIAFIAFFTAAVGTQLWRIICFVLFNFFSKHTPHGVLHNQRQVVLRNSTGPVGDAWALIKLLNAWHKYRKQTKPLTKLLPLLLCTILTAVALTVGSGLSSRIAQGTEVLIDGSNCGHLSPREFFSNLTAAVLLSNPYQSRRLARAAEHAQRCYESVSSSGSCGSFVRGSLPMEIDANASCPFDDSVCISPNSNILLDSGLMDSHSDFGLNAPPAERFKSRYQLQCAPLATNDYRSAYSYENVTYMRYQYGKGLVKDNTCNCTFAVNIDALESEDKLRTTPFLEASQEYSLTTSSARYTNGSFDVERSTFEPISELDQGKDFQLIFLLPNGMEFVSPSQDDWYRATTPTSTQIADGGGVLGDVSMYKADEPAWPMACIEQYEACKHGVCTGLGNAAEVFGRIHDDLQMASPFLSNGSYFSTLSGPINVIYALGRTSLASRYKATSDMQTDAGVTEWHLDVVHWFSTSLADLQYVMTDIAGGPTIDGDPELQAYVRRPNETERQEFCNNQKVRSTAYTSFSMFWLLFVLLLGLLIIVLSAILEPIALFIAKRLGPRLRSTGYARLEWRGNHALQLHRLAHEEVELGSWELGRWDTPITNLDPELAPFHTTGHHDIPQLMKSSNGDPATTRAHSELGDQPSVPRSTTNDYVSENKCDGAHGQGIEHAERQESEQLRRMRRTDITPSRSVSSASAETPMGHSPVVVDIVQHGSRQEMNVV
ncbi:hypothetical protein HJFPF1_10911 [Paramyrothecium foliicola]|nr:hypothetical protein HJFPF1_10911 [Paramyrothecium foliicola]